MKYAVDRLEGEYAILENIETKEIREVLWKNLPEVEEGSILTFINGEYFLDEEVKKKRLEMLKEKMNKLRNE